MLVNQLSISLFTFFYVSKDEKFLSVESNLLSYLETTLLKSVLKLFTLNANKTFDANCRTC